MSILTIAIGLDISSYNAALIRVLAEELALQPHCNKVLVSIPGPDEGPVCVGFACSPPTRVGFLRFPLPLKKCLLGISLCSSIVAAAQDKPSF